MLPDYDENPYESWNRDADRRTRLPRRLTRLLPGARKLPESQERRRALAVGTRPGGRKPIPACSTPSRIALAGFLLGQFGTQTMIGHDVSAHPPKVGPKRPARMPSTPSKTTRPSPGWLPESNGSSFPTNSIRSRSTRRSPTTPRPGRRSSRSSSLASIFENRLQFDRAADYLKRSQRESTATRRRQETPRSTRSSVPGASSSPLMTLPAGRGATVDFRFRNGKQVHFEAHEILFTKLLKDVKDYISSAPKQLDWQKLDISDIGSRLVALDQKQYLGRSVARWDLDLEPLPAHFDRRITVTTPLQKAGAYLLTAQMEGGNVSRIVVWLDDTVILKKPLEGKAYYFVADARTGQPIPGPASTSSAGARRRCRARTSTASRPRRSRTSPTATASSRYRPPSLVDPHGNFQWVITAATPEGRLAHLGFTNIWAYRTATTPAYDQVKVYTITDRPVYRPARRCDSSSGSRARATISPTPPISPASHSTLKSTIPKVRKSSQRIHSRQVWRVRRLVRAAVGRGARASIRSSCPTEEAGRSGSKNTRSPSSRSPSTPRPNR